MYILQPAVKSECAVLVYVLLTQNAVSKQVPLFSLFLSETYTSIELIMYLTKWPTFYWIDDVSASVPPEVPFTNMVALWSQHG